MVSAFRSGAWRQTGLIACVAIAIVSAWAVVASATVMVYVDLAKLVELSDMIVRGRVVEQTTFLDDETEKIKTTTTFEVGEVYFGDVKEGEKIQFTQYGGEYDGRTMHIAGDAQFEPYEESVIFLSDGTGKWAGGRYLTAMGQSKYKVVRGENGATVYRDFTDIALLNRETREIAPRSDERAGFASFEAELEALVAGIKGGDR